MFQCSQFVLHESTDLPTMAFYVRRWKSKYCHLQFYVGTRFYNFIASTMSDTRKENVIIIV